MKEQKDRCKVHAIAFLVMLFLAAGMMITSFFIPPQGVIDPTVLKGAAILLGFAALTYIPDVIKAGTDLHIQKGDFHVNLTNPDPVENKMTE